MTHLKKKYDKDGFYIFKNILNKKKLNDYYQKLLVNNYSKALNKKLNINNLDKEIIKSEKNKDFDKLFKANKNFSKSLQVRKLRKEISEILKKKLEIRKIEPKFSTLILGYKIADRLAYGWHQESSYNKGKTINVQLPLIRGCSKQNGTMSILKGSNKEKLIKDFKVKKAKKSVTSNIPKRINTFLKKYSQIFINMKISDFVAFDDNVLHKSNFNKTNTVRYALVFRYQVK